ncbi:MAG TPA: hypothetical protein VF256_12295 [Streptosporangiaceae bacterium]
MGWADGRAPPGDRLEHRLRRGHVLSSVAYELIPAANLSSGLGVGLLTVLGDLLAGGLELLG